MMQVFFAILVFVASIGVSFGLPAAKSLSYDRSLENNVSVKN